MRTDVSKIKFDGENVTMPLEVYEEIRTFARGHGELSLPIFEKLTSELPGVSTATVEVVNKSSNAK